VLIVFCGDFQYFCIFRRSCLSGRLRGCLIQRPSSSVLPGRVVKMAYPGYAKICWNFQNIIQQFDISNLITSIEIFMNYPKFPFLFSIFEIFTKFPFFRDTLGYAILQLCFQEQTPDSLEPWLTQWHATCFILIAIGGTLMVLGFLGCYGAIKKVLVKNRVFFCVMTPFL